MTTRKQTESTVGGERRRPGGKPNGKNGKNGKNGRSGRSQAARADKYELYQEAVQDPRSQCRFFERVFRKEYGELPLVLREDFCGAAAVCCEWVGRGQERRAHGYDLDPEPLAWGTEHNLEPLPAEARSRVQLVRQDVLKVRGPKADVISAENFSYFTFTSRDALRDYFRAARRNLARRGMFVLDIMGGPQVMDEDYEEHRPVNGATYIWEHHRFDPINHACTYFIHFKFRDGSMLKRAFRYDWRLWTIPEVRELLFEAGFDRVDVYWEGADDDGDGNGIFRRQQSAASDTAFIAYIVGVKSPARS